LFSNHAVAEAIIGGKKELAASPTRMPYLSWTERFHGSWAPKLDVLATEIAGRTNSKR
jgi:hypothetical protein